MNNEFESRLIDITTLPAISKIVSDAEDMLTNLCGTRVTVVIKMPRREELSMITIQEQVCNAFGVTWSQIVGKSRKGIIPKARFAYCYLCREYLKMPLQAIGDTIGGRDHTTVMHALSTVKDYIDTKDVIIAPMLKIIEETITYAEPKTA